MPTSLEEEALRRLEAERADKLRLANQIFLPPPPAGFDIETGLPVVPPPAWAAGKRKTPPAAPALKRRPKRPSAPPVMGLTSETRITPMQALGAPTAAMGATVGHLLDQTGDFPGALGAGLKAGVTAPITPLEEQTSPSKEAAARGIDFGPGGSLWVDLMMDPTNLLGGDPASDVLKGIAGGYRAARLGPKWAKTGQVLEKTGTDLSLAGGLRPGGKALNQVAESIHSDILSKGGVSQQPFTGEAFTPGDEGFTHGLYSNTSGKTRAIPKQNFTVDDVRQFIEDNAEDFAAHQGKVKPGGEVVEPRMLGGWTATDPETGVDMVYLDVSTRKPTARHAIHATYAQPQPGVARDPVTGLWPKMPQKRVFDLKNIADVPAQVDIQNPADFLRSQAFQQRMDDMLKAGQGVMGDKKWWNIYRTDLEKIYGKKNVDRFAGFLASTSGGSAPVHNLRAASEYMRRWLKGEDIIQPEFRIPETAVGAVPDPELGGFNSPGMMMPWEKSRQANLLRTEAGNYSQIQLDKMNDMWHALTGRQDVPVLDRHWAKLGEVPEEGRFLSAEGNKLPPSMETGKIDYYAIMENAVRDAAKRHGMPVNEFSATVWEGIRETIAKTGELYGTAHKAEAIPKVRGGFGDIVGPMIEQKAKAWGISVKEFKRRLGRGDAELLTAILSTPAGLAAYRQWEQEALPKNSDRRPQ